MQAIIPVRSGSKRVPSKNIRPFAGTTLLEHKISQLIQVPELDCVCVNSDSQEILEIAKKAGAKTYLRDPKYSTDNIPMNEVYAHIVDKLETIDILYATVTTPFIDTNRYSDSINFYFENIKHYDSLHTSSRVCDFMIREGQPLNYDPLNFPRSQDLPNIQKLVFGFSIISRELMMSKKSSFGYKPFFLQVDQLESLDIDSSLDFEIAEKLLLDMNQNSKK